MPMVVRLAQEYRSSSSPMRRDDAQTRIRRRGAMKKPGRGPTANAPTPAGGRAAKRVEQFVQERGLVMPTPAKTAKPTPAKTIDDKKKPRKPKG
jgi:hypothetical protein